MELFRTIAQIWTNRYPPVRPRRHSLIEKLVFTPVVLVRIFSIANVKAILGESAGHVFMDVYVLAFAIILTAVLFLPGCLGLLGTLAAAYRIADIVSYRVYFMLVKSQARPWSADVLRRSLVIAGVNAYETTVGYAILYLTLGKVVGTSPASVRLTSPISSLYYSVVTMTTLGYGDYVPGDELTRVLVMTQLFSAVLFLMFLIPALISLFSGEKTDGRASALRS